MKTQMTPEQKHQRTHRFLADRYFKAVFEKKQFYRKMMEMNDCRMIEEMVSETKKTVKP